MSCVEGAGGALALTMSLRGQVVVESSRDAAERQRKRRGGGREDIASDWLAVVCSCKKEWKPHGCRMSGTPPDGTVREVGELCFAH